MRIAPQTFCRQTCSVWCITITLVSKAFSLAQCFKKWKRWLQKDKIYVSWGRYQPISNSLVSSGSNYEAHFTWPVRDGQISPCFKLIRFWPFRRKKLDRPKKNNKWPVKDSRGKGFHIFWCSTNITFILPSPWRDVALRRCSIDENCAANLLQADMQCVMYNYNTCVESVLSCAMLQKMKTLTSEGQNLCFLGPISTYQQQFGQQRIELRSSLYVASAGWSDFTLF